MAEVCFRRPNRTKPRFYKARDIERIILRALATGESRALIVEAVIRALGTEGLNRQLFRVQRRLEEILPLVDTSISGIRLLLGLAIVSRFLRFFKIRIKPRGLIETFEEIRRLVVESLDIVRELRRNFF